MPIPIEAMLPEEALVIISEMILLAIYAFERMEAWLAFLCFEVRRIRFAVPLTAPR